MTRDQAVRHLLTEYGEQRIRNLAEDRRRMAEASKDPAIADILRLRKEMIDAHLFDAFDTPARAVEIVSGAHERMRAYNVALRTALSARGLPEDYLEPVHRCALCGDTGEVGEPLRRWCVCFEHRLTELLYSDAGMAELRIENFEHFDEFVFPDDEEVLPPGTLPGVRITQRVHMRSVRALCEQYADAFPNNPQRNLLFCGPSGVGKSFLMNCIAHRVLARGFTVARVTAPKLIDTMRRYHYNHDCAEQVAQWTDAQLLLLDDLGAEPMLENVTIVYLLSLLNDRMVARRHTVVSTNLNRQELLVSYTERLASRLLDAHTTRIIPFAGKDLRLLN